MISFATAKRNVMGVKNRADNDSLSLVSAGVAFYAFLSLFPAMTTAMSIYGLVSNAQSVEKQVQVLSRFVPADVLNIVSSRITDISTTENSSLTLGVVFGILLSLWSANKAMKAISEALNIAYNQQENRGFLKINFITLSLTLLSTLVFLIAIGVIVVVPIAVSLLLSNEPAEIATTVGSWMVLISLLCGMFIAVYKFAPAFKHRHWRELLPGAMTSVVLFVMASIGFSLYVSNFGEYDQQYGALGAVIVTLLWLYLGSYIFLLGAEINVQRWDINTKNEQPQSEAQTA